MASVYNKIIQKVASFPIRCIFKSKLNASGSLGSFSTPRFTSLCRCPADLRCLQSLLPLHSATANSRMNSHLSFSSSVSDVSCQGSLCHTSPDL